MELHRNHAHRRIHRTLKKHIPHGIHKAKRLVAFKYHKLLILCLSIILAYYVFAYTPIMTFLPDLSKSVYVGMFVAGFLFSFGFSAPFSVGFFILAQPNNLLLAALLGGAGATFGEMIIFKTIKHSFKKEFEQLEKKRIIRIIEKIVENHKHVLVRHYSLYIFAGILIALPVGDEIGVSMLAGLTTIKASTLAVISFLIQSFTVFLILYFSIV